MYTDWTHEHEWRITENVSLKKYPFYIIVKSNVYKEILLNEPKVQEAIKHTRGIIVFENEVSKNIELSWKSLNHYIIWYNQNKNIREVMKMEKCEFCSRKVLFGKKDMSNLLGARPVVLAKGDPVKRLELWLFGGEVDEQSVLHIGVSDYGGEENMMEMNIPINYCPRCGKKL